MSAVRIDSQVLGISLVSVALLMEGGVGQHRLLTRTRKTSRETKGETARRILLSAIRTMRIKRGR